MPQPTQHTTYKVHIVVQKRFNEKERKLVTILSSIELKKHNSIVLLVNMK
jgi:hypothetical protein